MNSQIKHNSNKIYIDTTRRYAAAAPTAAGLAPDSLAGSGCVGSRDSIPLPSALHEPLQACLPAACLPQCHGLHCMRT